MTVHDYGKAMLLSSPTTSLEKDLQSINENVIRMLSMVRESCSLARKTLIQGDVRAAQRCSDNDVLIDDIQTQLEKDILRVVEKRAPKGTDLRFLAGMYRALADTERAGDYAEHVAKAALQVIYETPITKYQDLNHIFGLLNQMLELTIQALVESNEKLVKDIFSLDAEIDDLYQQIQRELLTYMAEEPKVINQGTQLLNITRFLERLGDHIVNVGEHIIFWRTAKRIK